ncbi:OmpA family protein [Mucilaginibacter paludis]|uniref:OmpA/MotB domain protein n=1 Tax=Mucilaginibacter paludis DSM 18603 TaxID=714943 RepID=H1Y9V1_9SPHI|nr:OmpA family protein [Mucilaginibacter paludis]EHQ31134.1 OmpA/MotB domain protein [Mucilaginibacter paludis DSM 18603]
MMKARKNYSVPVIAMLLAFCLPACKSKKEIAKPQPPLVEVVKKVPEEKKPEPQVEAPKEVAPVVEKPDYNFSNLQFEFDSAILKTSSYPMLDKVARAMKLDASVKFVLNGYSSAEGTPEHNLLLSEERANSVKTYLLNAGVDASQLTAKGYGDSNPITPNTTEEGRVLNRRVEIKKQ